MSAVVGYRGQDAEAKALAKSRWVTPNPRTSQLPDGSLVGVGDTIVRGDGTRDRVLYGARGTSAWASEVWADEVSP